MNQDLVVTAVGPDRQGIVAKFSSDVFDAGANIAKSRMVNLRGQFAFVAHVEGTPEILESVKRRLMETASTLKLNFEFSNAPSTASGEGIPLELTTYSLDVRGIVKGFSTFLESHGVNIEELETEIESAVGDGSRIFLMRIVMLVPRTMNIGLLRRELDKYGDSLNCSVNLDRLNRR